jgi:hypothetical protein
LPDPDVVAAGERIAASGKYTPPEHDDIPLPPEPPAEVAEEYRQWVAPDAEALMNRLLATLRTYVVFPSPDAAVAVALWITATHCIKAFQHATRLVINSPAKRCGKSRLLDLIAALCHRPLVSVNATVAAIYRSLHGESPPTLVIDEADTIWGTRKQAEQNEDLRALINAGFQRNRPALRCVGPNQIPTEFPTFAMAVLAGIGDMPDTITDRAVNVEMRRRTRQEKVSQYRERRDGPQLARLRDDVAAWAETVVEALADAEPDMPVDDRAADTWEPLIAVADVVGGDWPQMARQACLALTAGAGEADEKMSSSLTLLADIRDIFKAFNGVPFMSSANLVGELRKVEESPWSDYDLNARKLAQRLKPYGVTSVRDAAGDVRGYRLEHLHDAFLRYLRQEPSEASETGSEQQQPSDGRNPSDTSIRQTENQRQSETPAHGLFLTDLTDSDDPPPVNGDTSSGHAARPGRQAPAGTGDIVRTVHSSANNTGDVELVHCTICGDFISPSLRAARVRRTCTTCTAQANRAARERKPA